MLNITAQSEVMKTIVDTLMTQVEDARFDFYDDYLEVCAVDASNVAMIQMRADSSVFDVWDLSESRVIVELPKIRDIVSLATSSDLVEMNFDGNTNRLNIRVGKINREVSPITEQSIRVPKRVPDIPLPNGIKINGSDLARALKAAKQVGDIVHLSLTKDSFCVKVPGDTDSVEVTFNDGELEELVCEGEVNSQYSLSYMEALFKKLDGVESVALAFGENLPLKMNFSYLDGAISVLFLLAPRQDGGY